MFALLYSKGFTQDTTETQSIEPVQIKIASPSPYYVFKAGDKSVGIDSKVDTSFDLKSINPEGIKVVFVFKWAESTGRYGEKGANGVVVIVLKESYILPKNLQEKFDEAK